MQKQNGFTFIELLIVIAIIAVIITFLFPARSRPKKLAAISHCCNNMGTLSRVWFCYADENKGNLVGGDIGQSEYDWLPKPVVTDRTDVEGQKTNIKKGKLWPYVKNIKTYHCPSDKRLEENNGPYLSYSIVGGLNGQDRYEEDQRKYKVATKYDQIQMPEEKIVFVEENAEFGWNPRSWQIYKPQDLTQWIWQDPIALRHKDRCAIGFADGHAEAYIYRDKRTLAMSKPPAESGTITGHTVGHIEQKDNPDLLYMKKSYTWLPKEN